MKKLLYLLIPIMFAACNGGDKKPGTVIVTPGVDTSLVIDTTIEEPGLVPLVADDATMRKSDKDKAEKQKKVKIICTFGHKKFNQRTRPEEEAPGGVKGRKPKPTKPPVDQPPTDPPTTDATNVIYLNFFGKNVDGTMWNTNGTIVAAHSGLAQSEMDYIVTQVAAGLTKYNVLVTYDESIYNAAPVGRKVEIIITESWEWFGQAGGVAYINSWWWATPTPAFVFSKLLNYNGHNIAEAARHEACHTLGLRHQSDCVGGVVTNQYRLGWTMGNSYYVALGIFGTGTSSNSCVTQDDDAMLITGLGVKLVANIRWKDFINQTKLVKQ